MNNTEDNRQTAADTGSCFNDCCPYCTPGNNQHSFAMIAGKYSNSARSGPQSFFTYIYLVNRLLCGRLVFTDTAVAMKRASHGGVKVHVVLRECSQPAGSAFIIHKVVYGIIYDLSFADCLSRGKKPTKKSIMLYLVHRKFITQECSYSSQKMDIDIVLAGLLPAGYELNKA